MHLFFRKVKLALSELWYALLLSLPDVFSKFRIRYYNRHGCQIHETAVISSNVRIKGKFFMDSGSSIAQNCTISGEYVGVTIGKNVMIAPNVVIVAFNHGYEDTEVPMVEQKYIEARIIIEDDVWIASNCTIGKGVRIGKGSIVAANSFVNRDIPPYSIAGGVPAKVIRSRIRC